MALTHLFFDTESTNDYNASNAHKVRGWFVPITGIDRMLSKIYPFPILILIIIPCSQLRVSVPSCLFPSGSPVKILCVFLFSHEYAYHSPRPSHPPSFLHPNNIISEECNLLMPSSSRFLELLSLFSLLDTNILFNTLISNTPNLCQLLQFPFMRESQ
jgi:hypothetical protein